MTSFSPKKRRFGILVMCLSVYFYSPKSILAEDVQCVGKFDRKTRKLP